MQPSPRTPSKADDKIERIKQSLSAKWGIRFPIRDATPSKRDKSLVEERISGLIQYLYFKEGALAYAIEQFEKNAVHVLSQWQFKPHGEPDMLPSLAHAKSALKQDFLKKQHVLSPQAVTELTESLRYFLNSVADRAKAGEKFPTYLRIEDYPINTTESSPSKPSVAKRRSSNTQWLRSKSEPGPAKSRDPKAQQPSSDDYPDHEMAELLAYVDVSEDPPVVSRETESTRRAEEPADIAHRSSSEDIFETPPTTPPKYTESSFASYETRKRACPDSMQAPSSRNVSRKTSSEKSAQESVYQHGLKTAEPMLVSDRRSMATRTKSSFDYPGPIAQNKNLEWESTLTFGRIENKSSIASSTPSVSSAGTSTNTSFSARSLATSFDSSIDGSDAAKCGYSTDAARQALPGFIKPRSDCDNKATKASTEKISAPPDPMDIDSESTFLNESAFQAEPLHLQDQHRPKPSTTHVGEILATRLHENPPFVQVPDHYPTVPFPQLYEITRVASACKIEIGHFSDCFKCMFASYDNLWSSLSSTVKAHGAHVPERSSLSAWERANSNFEGVALTGKLNLLDQQKGPCFEFQLNPLKLERSYRLSRKFGSDRYCVLGVPGFAQMDLPSYLKPHHTLAREAIIKWLVDTEHKFLGRTWRAFYTKREDPKGKGARISGKDSRISEKSSRYRIYLFAEDGVGFRDRERPGEADPRLLDRPRISVGEMIYWFMPFTANLNQSSLKFFARLALGVSSTIATVEFSPTEIFRADDARADTPRPWRLSYERSDEKKRQRKPSESTASVMNDGCARISRRAAKGVADCLGLDYVPCAFQGRIGGAKGMWMIDAQDEIPSQGGRNYWIEITDSQLKFEGHGRDEYDPEPARVTFEVNAWTKKLFSRSLNFQLLPILVDRGVPPDVIARLLEQDLTDRVGELGVAMDSGLALRKWNQEQNPITEERARYGGIEMQGGLPASRAETINWFTEHGFQPKTCRYLKHKLYQAIKDYCFKLESKMNIGLGQSAYAYMIADPLAILEENEIHLGFSSVFHDRKSGFDQSMLHNMDVLVARSPAHLPSDIQKVRAVFKPELMMYRDVVVFPSKGPVSLASKLSGGDYDGDQAWVCWDQDIVQPFTNADVPSFPPLEFYGIEKDTSTVADIKSHPDFINAFLRHAFNFNLQPNMLGQCSVYHEAYCYHQNSIDRPQAISIAILLGNLVDSAKGGFQFDEAKWFTYLKKNELRPTLPTPAYKDSQNAKPTIHLIDRLVFVVAKRVRERVLHEFDKRFTDVSPRDDDLFRIRNEEYEEAKSNRPLTNVLKNLETGLKEIHRFWSVHAIPEDADENLYRPRKSDAMTWRNLIERCRADFVALKPTLDDSLSGETSDRISIWQRDHARGRCSYWDLLKASVAFHHYYRSTFIWHVAGVELGEIKATARGRGTYRPVVGEVFEAFKLDRRVVDRVVRKERIEREGGSLIGEEDRDGGDDDDEFGVWGWGVDDC